MSTIDNQIVSMTFDNEAFERRLSETIGSLDKLRDSIDKASATSGLSELETGFNNFNTTGMASAIDTISSKLTAMGAIGFTVIQNLTTSALDFVRKTGNDILGPILSGGKSRAENIQQAQFMFRGLGIDVEEGMKSALDAVRGTAYGLDQAAKAAAQFGASGIKVGDEMTSALRGVAGAAAMTGSSFTEIADIFAGSAGTGKVTNQDLMQFATRGLNAAAAVGKVMGKTEAQIHEMATAGTLDFKTFAKAMDEAFGKHATEANQLFSGALANLHAAMSRLGASFFGTELFQLRDIFNSLSPVVDKVNEALQPLIKTFLDFSGEKTYRIVSFLQGLNFDNFKAAILYVSAGIQNLYALIQQIAGVAKEAFREIFPKSSTSGLVRITKAFSEFTERIKIGGDTLANIKSVFRGLFSVISIGYTIVKDFLGLVKALFQVFISAVGIDSGAGKVLQFFANFGESLTNLKTKLVDNEGIRTFFVKLFAIIFDAGKEVGKFIDKIKDLDGQFKNSTGFQTFATFVENAKEKVKEFFGILENHGSTDSAENSVGRVQTRLEEFMGILGKVKDVLGYVFENGLHGVFTVLDKVLEGLKTWFSELGGKLAGAFKPGDFDAAVDIVNVGLLGGIATLLVKFFKNAKNLDFGTGIVNRIKTIFSELGDTLKTFQLKLKSEALFNIAKAVALLVASILVLSLIDSAALTKALTAITVAFSELIGSMVVLDKIFGGNENGAKVKFAIVSAAMIGLSTAMVILTGAIKIMSTLNWATMTRGLAGTAAGLALLVAATHLISTKDAFSMTVAGAGMVAMASGLVAITAAVKIFGSMDWGVMAKGLAGVTGALFVITVAMSDMPLTLPVTAAGIVILSGALLGMYEAVKSFGSLDWAVMGKGLLGIAGALLLINVAMDSMPLSMPLTAAGLLVLSGALVVMAKAVNDMGSLDAGVIGKGIGSIAAMLLILDAALQGMEGAIPGALALVITAGALDVLANVLQKLGAMDNHALVQAMLGIAGTLSIIALGALLIEPVVPALIGLAIALDLISAAALLFGAGSLLFAKSMDIMATAGIEGTKGFIKSIELFVEAIPDVFRGLILAFVDNIDQLIAAVPLLVRLLEAVIDQLLDTIIKLAPKMGKAIVIIIEEIFKILRAYYPDLIKTGLDLLMHLLQGIRDNIGEITHAVADIVVNFLKALNDKIPELVDAVYNLLHTVIVEVVRKIAEEIPSLTVDIGVAIIEGFLTGLEQAAGSLYDFFTTLPSRIINIVKEALGIKSPSTKFAEIGGNIIEGLLQGLINAVVGLYNWFIDLPGNIIGLVDGFGDLLSPEGIELIKGFLIGILEKEVELVDWFTSLPGKILGWIGEVGTNLKDKGKDLIFGLYIGILEKASDIISWFQDLPDKIVGWIGDIAGKLKEAGIAAIQGLIDGIVSMKDTLVDKSKDVFGWLVDPIGSLLDWNSPSKYMRRMGVDVLKGLLFGLGDMKGSVTDASLEIGQTLTDSLQPKPNFRSINASLAAMADNLGSMENFNPVVTPVMDLTKIEEGSKKMGEFMKSTSIAPDVSFDSAKLISATLQLSKTPQITPPTETKEVTFIQNNHSPEALSTNDIYRATKSVVSTAKEELGI